MKIRKIELFLNGAYAGSTTRYQRCKDAVSDYHKKYPHLQEKKVKIVGRFVNV